MKVRIYSPFLPYPVTEGAFRVIFDQVFTLLSLKHEVELVTWKDGDEAYQKKITQWIKLGALPEVRRLAMTSEDTQLKRVWLSLVSDVASPEVFYYPPLQSDTLETLGSCDLAIYHYSFAHHWLKQKDLLPNETKRVVHFHNLESELFDLRAKTSPFYTRAIHRNNARTLQSHEADLGQWVDELWFVSPVDAARWKFFGGQQDKVRLIPPTYTFEISNWRPQVLPDLQGVTDHNLLGFIGGMKFKPNQESALWIIDQLLPELDRKGFQGKILMLGHGAQEFFRSRELSSRFEILPENTDLSDFFSRLSWMLVPHVSGSGVRIKLLDALAQKIPVLATPEAVERLHPDLQHSPLIVSSSDPKVWADRIISEKPFESRLRYRDLPFADAMRGEVVYQRVLQG